MDYLIEMVKVVNKNKTKNIQLIGTSDAKNKSKMDELYDGLLNGDFSKDAEACEALYKTDKVNQNYRNLKSKFEKRLINTLFLIDVNDSIYSGYQKAYYSCYKNFAAIKILQGKGSRVASVKLTEKTLTQAIKFEFSDLIVFLAKDLRIFYGTIIGDKKKFDTYNHLLKEHQFQLKLKDRAIEMYSDLASHFTNSKSAKPELIEKANHYVDLLNEFPDVKSRNLCLYSNLVVALKYEIENDFEGTIKTCDKAIMELQQYEIISDNNIFTFLFKKLNGLIQLRKYEEAEITVQKCLRLQPEGSINWLIALQFYFILLFRSQNFQKAYELFREKQPLKKSKNAPQVLMELWHIINAYLYYFVSTGKIILPPDAEKKPFRIKKFLNEVPVFSKDKKGMKVSILILHLLFLLHKKEYNEVISRTETLQSFASKYLRKDETYRSNCFIKMLIQIPASNFNPIALERRTKINFEKLKSRPLEMANQPNEIEMVPYEILWKFVMDSLSDKEIITIKKRL